MQSKRKLQTQCFLLCLGMLMVPSMGQAQDLIVNGDLGVGISNPARAVHVQGDNAVFRLDRDRDSASFILTRTALFNFNQIWKSFVVGVDATGVNNGKFVIKDFGTAVAGGSGNPNRMTIDTNGRVGFNTDTPVAALDVRSQNGVDALLELYNFSTRKLSFSGEGDFNLFDDADIFITANNGGVGDDFWIRTTGEQLKFATDLVNGVAQSTCYTFYNNGSATGDRIMDLSASGNLRIDGTLTENVSFDLAESFWKSDPSIQAGDVVRIDPTSPISVVKAGRAQEPAVVGVVSTEPGIILGGSAFSQEQLEDVWGTEIADIYKSKKKALATKALINRAATNAGPVRPASRKDLLQMVNNVRAKVDADEWDEVTEDAALTAFFAEHFAGIALAGRVPVKVDASYGAIAAGDLLVASPTPGHAMRIANPQPGTVVGKALEAKESGTGLILMLVMQR